MQWEAVIGLEIHAQLSTESKIFSGASTGYGAAANTQACAIDLGLPGVLPVLNASAVRKAVMFGLAINAEIAPRSVFARKNYFYPDLPKGYQISQYELPIVGKGHIDIELDEAERLKRVTITRAHLEEDAGKSVHEGFGNSTGIDLNRAGTPLLEIVSEPDMRSSREAVAYMRKIHALVRYLGICDGNMQEGSFRCDANVSIRPAGSEALGTRTEIKNLNSFRFVERAIDHEIERQADVLESHGAVVQETRLYAPDKDETRSMRGKEEANDYRYFPDPDLLPVEIESAWVAEVRAELPELPDAKAARYENELELSAYDARRLTTDRDVAAYFEQVVTLAPEANPKVAANWVLGEIGAALNREDMHIDEAPVTAGQLGVLLQRLVDGTLSGKTAKVVFDRLWEQAGSVDEIIEREGLQQVTDATAIEALVNQVLADNPDQVEQFRNGKNKVFGFFVGQVMKASQGKANPQQVNDLLRSKLND